MYTAENHYVFLLLHATIQQIRAICLTNSRCSGGKCLSLTAQTSLKTGFADFYNIYINLSIYHIKKKSKYSPNRKFLNLICVLPLLPSPVVQEGEISLHKVKMDQDVACHASTQGHLPTQYDEKDRISLCVWLFSSEMTLHLSCWQQLWVCCVCVNDGSAY